MHPPRPRSAGPAAGGQPGEGAATPVAPQWDDLSLVQRFPGPIAYWDSELRHVVSSSAYQAHYGVDSASIAESHLPDVLGEGPFSTVRPAIEHALAGHRHRVRVVSTDPDLGTRWTEETYEPDVVGGEVRGLYVSLVDVTPDVQVQRLSQQGQRLAELGTWTVDPRTQRITWSEEMYRIMGRDPEAFTPEYDALVTQIHPDDVDRVVATTREAMEDGAGFELDYRVVRTDGQVREVHSRVHGERDADGDLVMVYGMLQDLTARKTLLRELADKNAQLRRLNQLHEDVLGLLGHDVKQPLTVVLGQLETVLDSWDPSLAEDQRQRLQGALAAARRLVALCNNILTLTRSASGAIEAWPSRVEVLEVVGEALEDLDRSSEVVVATDGTLPAVHMDPVHLRQMVVNLVSNAFRYGAEPVRVSVSERPGGVVLEVTDWGDGVPTDFVPHLFDRFTRAEDSAARQASSGFGLYVVRRLAEANRASVVYEPHLPHGAVFRLTLPPWGG